MEKAKVISISIDEHGHHYVDLQEIEGKNEADLARNIYDFTYDPDIPAEEVLPADVKVEDLCTTELNSYDGDDGMDNFYRTRICYIEYNGRVIPGWFTWISDSQSL